MRAICLRSKQNSSELIVGNTPKNYYSPINNDWGVLVSQ